MNRIRLSLIALVAMTAVSPYAWSSTLVYQPNNPNFGGNPANGPNLLNEANAQNKHTDPSLSAFSSPTSTSSLDQFNAQLQQAILSRVAGSVTNSIVGTNGELKPGTISTGNFTIVVSAAGNGNLQVTTTDKTTGATSTFIVSNGQ
ncbi:curli assembly protein CsgF [Burkholderia contaminans FFH2055]|jgi:curli production assembly/transport component CsgF|uniref:Curli production assembly/transport component CsgF n=3 Tax=Bacteria TaxID=2 RepID=A0A0G3YZE7_9BURK|nr:MULTISPECIES: curli assembly protein CsgF [Burkholderia]EKS9797281.1 curli assembly protein CsgF [Burkholderia cepacia]KKL32388.1 curli assembly protein CsgF [Burkholderia contaminans LMG 23361]OXI57572.1 curli assembly protein CsgF [Burkholderia sp. AU27893]OXI95422.1 curli assembly protein CsgF [Burkholderia sp. AU33803]OXI97892.1 curli assembly protein CsgF [Burkholderia sp. AU33647]